MSERGYDREDLVSGVGEQLDKLELILNRAINERDLTTDIGYFLEVARALIRPAMEAARDALDEAFAEGQIRTAEEWCFDLNAVPKDNTPILVTVPSCQPDEPPIVGEAYFNPKADNGTWWWAGTSAADYPAISINEGNELPIAWRSMPAAAVAL